MDKKLKGLIIAIAVHFAAAALLLTFALLGPRIVEKFGTEYTAQATNLYFWHLQADKPDWGIEETPPQDQVVILTKDDVSRIEKSGDNDFYVIMLDGLCDTQFDRYLRGVNDAGTGRITIDRAINCSRVNAELYITPGAAEYFSELNSAYSVTDFGGVSWRSDLDLFCLRHDVEITFRVLGRNCLLTGVTVDGEDIRTYRGPGVPETQ